jgi:two-component system invasion response regulator UvrY
LNVEALGVENFLQACKVGTMKTILIIDDHAVVRDGVKKIFDEQPETVVFGEASTEAQALQLAREQDWDLVVLDLSLGNQSGLEVLKELKQIRPRLPVLILSMHSEEQYARRAFKAGASGYITKDSSRAELAKAVNKVAAGGRYVTSALAERLAFDLGRGSDRPPHETLSDREFEVMRLIASGKTVREIADLLSLSDKTISTYRARLLEKMGMKTNAELTHYAFRNKLVD